LSDLVNFESTTSRPDGFETFWADTRAELEKLPLSLELERSALRSTPDVDTYEVTYTSLTGAHVFAWLCVPNGDGPYPGLAIYPGYSGAPLVPRAWAKLGYVALQVSPRGHPKSDVDFDPGFPGLMTSGIDEPRSYAYRGLYCDAWRAIDVLLARPEVDKARIGVTGGSQGGALSLIAGAGRPEVRAIAADVPFLTSIRDALKLSSSYPYEEVKDYLRLQPTYEERALATLDHVDTVNFADQIKAPTLLSIGLRDDICPPQTGYALYNRLSCPRELRVYPDGAHEGGGFVHAQLKVEWLAQQLKEPRAS
jgi:cephalosporin-C deacetylase